MQSLKLKISITSSVCIHSSTCRRRHRPAPVLALARMCASASFVLSASFVHVKRSSSGASNKLSSESFVISAWHEPTCWAFLAFLAGLRDNYLGAFQIRTQVNLAAGCHHSQRSALRDSSRFHLCCAMHTSGRSRPFYLCDSSSSTTIWLGPWNTP